MGFIEDLRNKRLEDERSQLQAQLIARQNAEKERLAGLEKDKKDKDERERKENFRKENLRKAKEQFEQTGIREMAQELINIKAAESFQEEDDRYREGIYKAQLIIRYENKSYSHSYYYVGIAISSDGIVEFEGKEAKIKREGFLGLNRKTVEVPLKIKIYKSEWKGNINTLETALGKVYNNPQREITWTKEFYRDRPEDHVGQGLG